jgi:hypothetical protein
MTMPADNAPDAQDSVGQAPPTQDVGPETEAEAREREVQRRLTQSGREAAEARRAAAAASAQAAAQQAKIVELEAATRLLTANLQDRDRREAETRQAQIKAELERLPPADRLQRQIEMLQGQITDMQTAGAQRQPVQQQAPPVQQPTPPQYQATDDERRAYMEQRVKTIVDEAERAYGVRPNLDAIADADWETEDAFTRAVMTQARSSGGTPVAAARKPESAEEMRTRIRQEERERLGATAPNAARAAAPAGRRTKAASEDDVRGAAQTYNSKLGPKENLKRMQQLRETMG